MSQQRILIVLESGAFQGASVTTDTGSPVPLDLAALGKLLPEINAAAVQTLDSIEATHAAAIAAKDEEIAQITAARDAARAAFEEKSAYQAAMEERVSTVLQSGDIEQMTALAVDFLTPAQVRERAEKLAKVEALKAEAAALEAELGIE